MKVLVTGGAGFVGTNLAIAFRDLGHEVVVIDNYATGLRENCQDGIQYVEVDLAECREFSDWGPFDVVYHLAATARIGPSFEAPAEYFRNNAGGTLNVVDWCARNEVPLIYSGSSSKWSGKFKNPYTFSKDVGEEVVELYRQHFDLKATIARFYNVYGPYQLLGGDFATLIGRWIYNLREGIECEVFGDGEQRRDFTHVDDIVEALILIQSTQSWGHDFELGRGANWSVNEVAQMMGITPVYRPGKKGEARNTLNQDNSAQKILGWKPERNLKDYLDETLSK